MRWRRLLIPGLFLLVLALGAGLAYWFFGLPLVTFNRPWFLLALLLIPALIVYSYRGLLCLGEFRCWTVLLLRSAIIAALVLALADMRTVKEEESSTLIVVLDLSYSMPQELEAPPGTPPNDPSAARLLVDKRREKLAEAIRQATREHSGPRRKTAVVVFGKRPRLEFPATELSELNIKSLTDAPDRNHTDIAHAIRLALASFPEGTTRRMLIITDGNENRGDALKEARNAQLNGVPIDVVPIKYQYTDEVVVERIDAPSETLENRDLPIRVIIRNHSNRQVRGNLTLSRIAGDREIKAQVPVVLGPGLNAPSLKWPATLGASSGSFSYKAVFHPESLPNDRADNNVANAPVMVRSEGRRVLLVVPDKQSTDWEVLQKAIENAPFREGGTVSKRKLEINVWTPDMLPNDKDIRLPELSNYDAVVFYNIPADVVPKEKQEVLRKNIRDQGAGFVMIGGKDSFGAGRWQGEPLEEALPVNNNIQSLKVQAKGGLVLIMHASEMSQGNFWQKEIARLAVNKLSPADECGVIYYEHSPSAHKWHVELQPVGPNRKKILDQITSMQPGDMPQFDPAIKMAHESLTQADRGIGTKHIILCSDGDHGLLGDLTWINKLRASRVTMTTVGVTTHGPAAQQALETISKPTGGRHYAVTAPEQLPGIYLRETRIINQNFLYERAFRPEFGGERADPLREWTIPFPNLFGYVRTQAKDSQLVQVLLRSPAPSDDLNPILAQWQYGLGRVVCFTSDAGAGPTSWARDWAQDPNGMYTEFWGRIMDWAVRSVDEAGLSLQSRMEGTKVRITLMDNRDKAARAKKPLSELKVTVNNSGSPDAKTATLEPVSPGVYEAVVDAEGSGAYNIAASGQLQDDKPDPNNPDKKTLILARDAFAVPYSSEFAAVKDNEGLLREIARETNGRVISEEELATTDVFRNDQAPSRNLQPIWYWLLLVAAGLLFFDVGMRRIAIEPEAIGAKLMDSWSRLRGRSQLSTQSQEYMERLKSRKATVGEQLERSRSTRRFEASPETKPVAATEPATATASRPETRRPIERPTLGAEKEQEAMDFATRLMRAKQKAREKMDGDEPK